MDEYVRQEVEEQITKLWALPNSITAILIQRGIGLASLSDAMAALVEVNGVITAGDAIASSFRPGSATPKFGVGRFGDGSYPVFYAAQDEKTCIEEVKARIGPTFASDPYTRHFKVLNCDYAGLTLILVGHEGRHPELVSKTKSGYPFCQALAARARDHGIDGLHAPSARWKPGVCVPVFSEPSLVDCV